MEKQHKQFQTLFLGGSKITADGDCSHEIKTPLLLGKKVMTNLDSILKSRDNKGPSSQSYGFSSSHVWMWELDYKGSWVLNNWSFWTAVLKTLKSALDCKEIQPVHPEGDQSWISTAPSCGSWAQQLRALVASLRVEAFRTRDQTRVPCTGR